MQWKRFRRAINGHKSLSRQIDRQDKPIEFKHLIANATNSFTISCFISFFPLIPIRFIHLSWSP